jgi:hypothetical protein
MANHPNRGDYRYLKVSSGFANRVVYLRVPVADVAAADAEFAEFEDRDAGHTSWTHDKRATMPGAAVDWADRDMVLGIAGRNI